jgi:hypothetical protein
MSLVTQGYLEEPKCPNCGGVLPLYDTFKPYQYCSIGCKKESKPANNSISVLIDGKEYRSVNDASRELGIERWLVMNRIMDRGIPDWMFVGDHDEICIKKLAATDPRLTDEKLLREWKESGETMKSLCDSLGIKTHATTKLALLYFGIDTSFDQLPKGSSDKLNDKEWFVNTYNTAGPTKIKEETGCSQSTVLNRCGDYGIPPKRRASAIELYFRDWITNLGFEIKTNVKNILPKREIDIYVPSKNLSIEFDGLTFHSEVGPYGGKPSHYHSEHSRLCMELGITPMRFTDYETGKRLDLVKSMIKSKLGISDVVLYARKCDLVELKAHQVRTFLNQYHLQGFANARHYFGLYHQGDLVFVMSFGVPRYDKKYDWEIIRVASKMNTNVVGAMSKVYSHFRKMYIGQTILTYSDLRVGLGNSYMKLGMKLNRVTNAGYFYHNKDGHHSRHRFQKHCIRRMCPVYDPTLPEETNARNNGYIRYFDCGNLVFDDIL